jgi:rhodanese-related sulfurtransferase
MNRFFTLLLSPLLILIGSCGKSQVNSKAYSGVLYTLLSHSVNEVSVANVIAKTDSLVFLDAREIQEYEVSHLKNATHIGYDNFDIKSVASIDKSQPIIVYCSVGYRSEKIALKLINAGFTDVSNLYGGIFEWVNNDQKVFHENQPTKKVHAFDKTWGVWLEKGEKVY